MKTHKSHTFLLLSALVMMLMAVSCVGVDTAKKLKVHSCKLAGIQMPSFENRSVEVTILADVENPASYLRLAEIQGQVHTQGTPVAFFAFDDISIEGKSKKEYALHMTVTPAPEMSILRIFNMIRTRAYKDCVFDISFRMSAHPTAKGMKCSFKNQPVEKLFP